MNPNATLARVYTELQVLLQQLHSSAAGVSYATPPTEGDVLTLIARCQDAVRQHQLALAALDRVQQALYTLLHTIRTTDTQ
jgi:hypothetical protein